MDNYAVAHMQKIKELTQLNKLLISLKKEIISWQEVVVKEEDLEDPIRAEETKIIGIGSPRTHQRITRSRRSIYWIAFTQLGQPVRQASMR